jgi:ATP-dependent Clp protease protease subunit
MNINEDFKKFAKDRRNISSLTFDEYQKYSMKNMLLNPYILEERQMNVTPLDIYSRMLLDRIIFFNNFVDSDSVNISIAQLLYLDSIEDKGINMYINTRGGECNAGLALVDTMNIVKSDISTIVIGNALSMGAVILVSGTEGKRMALPHSRIMIHQPSGGTEGKSTEIEIYVEEMRKEKQKIYEIFAEKMGKTVKEIEDLCKDDKWFNPSEAIDMKIIDKIVEKK